MAYATSDLDAIVTKLQSALATGTADVEFEGKRLTYRSVADILKAISYFESLYPQATDAPPTTKPKVRTFFFFGNKGFRV